MNDFSIIIDNIYEVDTVGKSISFPTTYQVIDIKDLNKRAGNSTKTIALPRTEQNDKIFGLAFQINGRNQFSKYAKREIRFIKDGAIVFDGVFNISEVTKSEIKIYCFGTLSKVKQLLGEKTLNDLDLADLDHLYTNEVFGTWFGSYPSGVPADYFYPLIDYGRFQKSGLSGSSETPDILISDMYPALYVRRAFQQMCLDSGYTLVSDFFNKPEISKLLIPFTNEIFVHDETKSIEINGFEGFNVLPQTLPTASTGRFEFDVSAEVYDTLGQWDLTLDEYTAAFSQTSLYTVDVAVDFAIDFYKAAAGKESKFIVQLNKGFGWFDIRTELIQGTNFDRNTFRLTYEGSVSLLVGDKIRFQFLKGDNTVEMILGCSIKINPSAGGKLIEVGEVVQIAPNLPPIKQIDLFTAFFKMFNLIIDVNDETGQIFIETETDYYLQGGQKDFSEKISMMPEPIIEYTPVEYSRNYVFKYKHDESDYFLTQYDSKNQASTGYLFGDGEFSLSKDEEPLEVGEVLFSPTVVEKSFTYNNKYLYLPCILSIDTPFQKVTNHQARILSYGGMVDVSALSGGLYTNISLEGIGTTTQVPYCFFAKQEFAPVNNFAMSLNFSDVVLQTYVPEESLVKRYYKASLESLSVSARLIAYFNLTARDISELNFSTFWYIEYFNGIFKLNKILDYNPANDSLTKVELINVGVYDDMPETFMEIIPIQPKEDSLLLTENSDFVNTEDNNFIKV